MRTITKKTAAVFTIGLVLAAVFFGCKNPLVSVIEEDVAVAVTPPRVSSVFPEIGSADVAVTTNYISIEFTKPIAVSTVSSSSIIIADSAGVKLAGNWSVNDKTVTFTPNGSLSYSETYTITITSALLDTDANALTESYSWSFNTGIAPDTSMPVIGSVVINNTDLWSNALSVSITIDASDNYDTATTTSVAQMNINESGWQPYSTTAAYTLPAGEGLRSISVRVKDGSGNESETVSDTINIDTTAPAIGYFHINDGKSATNTTLVSLDIGGLDDGSGSDEFRYKTLNSDWTAWAALTEGSASLSDIVLAIALGSTESFEAEIRDLAGNVSIIDTAYITYENIPPAVTLKHPDGQDADDYPINGGLVWAEFNEEIDTDTITPGSFYILSGTSPLSDTSIVISEDKKTVQLVGFALSKNSDYTVIIEDTVSDVAGNTLSEGTGDYSWTFHAGSAIDATPPDGTIVLDETQPTHFSPRVTSNQNLTFDVSASDDYNTVDGMMIWGNSDGSVDPDTGSPYARFEQDAEWLEYSTTKNWILPADEGFYSIHYKFMDVPQNQMPDNKSLEIALDTSDPMINEVSIIDYTGADIDDNGTPNDPADDVITTKYTNNPNREVTFVVDAEDAISGINEMWVSTDGVIDTEPSADWTPIQTITLPAGDGLKEVLIGVRDYVGRPAAAPVSASEQIILDLTPPEVSFTSTDYIQTNDAATQTGSFTDVNGVVSYLWEQDGGSDEISFDDVTAENPEVTASVDGEFKLRVTIEDPAGNSTFGVVDFIKDTLAPTGTITIADIAYSTTNQPEWDWSGSSVSDFDYYRISMNDDAFGSYVDRTETSYFPEAALSEGSNTIYIKAMDYAENGTATANTTVFVDTAAPVFTNSGTLIETNGASEVILTAAVTDPNGANGSGIADITWTKDSGTGTVTFTEDGDSDIKTIAVDVPGDENDTYTIECKVTDTAGNIKYGNYILVWDTTAPATPTVDAPSHTPNLQPSWSWTTGGGGSGNYRYKLERSTEASPAAFTEIKGWTAIADTNYELEGAYSLDHTNVKMSLQEYDDAGNISAAQTATIWLDSTFTSPPNITRDGAYLRNGESGAVSVTWSWTTGLPPSGGNTYRYKLDDPDLSSGTSSGSSDTFVFANDGTDTVHTLYVEQYNDGATAWTNNPGSSTVRVDTADPNAPTITTRPADPTNDVTPTWYWSSGGSADATNYYRYRINSGGWTYTYSTGATPSLSTEGAYTFEIQQQDVAGNWSSSSSDSYTLDRTPPVLDGIQIDSNASYTGDLNVTISVTGYSGSPNRMYIWDSEANSGLLTGITSRAWTLPDSDDGNKYVYCRLYDAAGNYSSYKYDYIYLDRTPPTINSFSINGGDTSTNSTSVTLNSSVSDTSGIQYMRIKNGAGSFSGWYSYSTARSWNMSSGAGAKKVSVEYRDYAGNTTAATITEDEIFYGAPSLKYATKGNNADGNIGVYVNTYGNETSGENRYEIRYAWTTTGSKYLKSWATTTDFEYTGMQLGKPYYFFVHVYNTAVGAYSDYSLHQVGFSSNVTVVYDAADTTDTANANTMKTLIEDRHGTVNSSVSWVTGTWPYSSDNTSSAPWVTLLPETEVSSSWYSSDERYIIHGDPVIVTAGTSVYLNTNKTRNIMHRSNYGGVASPDTLTDANSGVDSGGGIIAMGSTGAELIDKIRYIMSTYSYTDQAPTEIGGDYSDYYSTSPDYVYQWTTGEGFLAYNPITRKFYTVYRTPWSYPLTSSYFAGGTAPTHNAQIQITYQDLTRKSVERPTDTNPPGGFLYARDPADIHHYTVARQGRFLQYGFNGFTDRYYTGMVFYMNILGRMDDF